MNNFMNKENKKTVRVRFAPSPTGYFHIGSARVALFNFLHAKKNNGVFVLRIEDTDKERSKKEYEEDIMRSINWLKIVWDEGVVFDTEEKRDREVGDFGPYRQSRREDIYKKYILKLIEEGKAYYCFCTKEDLEAVREKQRDKKEAPCYEGGCFNLSKEEVEKNIKDGKNFTVRLRVPKEEKLSFVDKIRGEVVFNSKDIGGDFVIAKGDLSPLYNFACVVDDHKMGITDVVRGEDHISNTPKQILIQKALQFDTPFYAHLPLILGTDKSKLSKRHGAVSLYEYKKEGYLPEAIVNFIAFLGWNPGDEKEVYSLEEMIEKFSLEKCQKSGAIFDIKKLEHINGVYIRKMDVKELTKKCVSYLIDSSLISSSKKENGEEALYNKDGEEITFEHLSNIVSLYQERLKKLSEITELVDYLLTEDIFYEKELLFWKNNREEETISAVEKVIEAFSLLKDWTREEVEKTLLDVAEKEENRGFVLWPTRVALSGKKASASPFDIAWVLGREKTIKRLKMAKNKLN